MRTALILGGLLAALDIGPAHAVENYDDCDGFVTGPVYNPPSGIVLCLNQDIVDPAGTGQTIRLPSNSTLDCKHHRLVGAPGAVAIRMEANIGYVVVRNCDIQGYTRGIEIIGGSGVRIENNRIEGATLNGIHVNAAHSVIRGNAVIDTGAADSHFRVAGIEAVGGVHVIDNVVSGVQAGTSGRAIGIYTLLNGAGSVVRNQVSGLVPPALAAAYGIYNSASGRITVEGNHVRNGVRGGVGILCENADATAARNIVSGFDTGVSKCLSVVNTVN